VRPAPPVRNSSAVKYKVWSRQKGACMTHIAREEYDAAEGFQQERNEARHIKNSVDKARKNPQISGDAGLSNCRRTPTTPGRVKALVVWT
jgi:hypothetical protein